MIGDGGEHALRGLFGQGETPVGAAVVQPAKTAGLARVTSPRRNPKVDPFDPKPTDRLAQAQRRSFMTSDFANPATQPGITASAPDLSAPPERSRRFAPGACVHLHLRP